MAHTFRRALVLAAAVHGLALLVTHAARLPTTVDAQPVASLEPTTFTTEMIAIELGEEQPPAIATSSGAAPGTVADPLPSTASPTASPHLAIATKPEVKIPGELEKTIEQTPAPTPTTASSDEGIASAPPSTGTGKTPYVVPELGKKPSWMLPPILPGLVGAAGTSTAGAPLDTKTAQKQKEEKLAAKLSKDVGTMVDAQGKSKDGGAGGPVIGAAHAAAHDNPLAPETGIAVFEVKTDAAGVVKSVTVLSTNGDAPGWNAVAVTMRKDLASKKLTVPSGANGMKVTVRIQAKLALPSGATGSGINPYVSGVGGGFGFDLSDIGQKPMRVVSVTELEESRL